MKQRIMFVPEADAEILEIGQDCGDLGQDGYVIEKISEPLEDERKRRTVAVTLVKRTKH